MLRWAALPISFVLVLFNLRRVIFTLAAFQRNAARREQNPPSAICHLPSAIILVPCRDEAATLPGLIERLARLDYPPDRVRVALIDDGSRDETFSIAQAAAGQHSGWQAIHFDVSRGKAQALNEALACITFGDVIVVYDADHRPEPDSLKRLVAAFDDPDVAGASGRTIPINPMASLPAYYAAVEGLVHQMITMRAKDRLGLAPALLGSNCAYRRSALMQVGGFRPGALLEDSDLTLALARLGYRLRFVPEAIAWHQLPETVEGYLRQHLRWARGFDDVARDHAGSVLIDRRLPLRLRMELALFSLGYLDRLALLAAAGMQVLHRVSALADEGRTPFATLRGQVTKDGFLGDVLKIALLMPLAQIVAVFISERAPLRMWLRLPAVPLLFGLDVLVAVRAVIESMLNRPRVWTQTKRVGESASQRVGESAGQRIGVLAGEP